ncbi:hypothetical protein ACR6C2_14025 [Streptomyces sp. INA 01156]
MSRPELPPAGARPADGRTVRVEVSDARAERAPRSPAGDPETTGTGPKRRPGRGRRGVGRPGVAARLPSGGPLGLVPTTRRPGKTVWAEYAMTVR